MGERMVIPHGFIKKTNKTSPKTLALARARLQGVKHAAN